MTEEKKLLHINVLILLSPTGNKERKMNNTQPVFCPNVRLGVMPSDVHCQDDAIGNVGAFHA